MNTVELLKFWLFFWAFAYCTWFAFVGIMGMKAAYDNNTFAKRSFTYYLCLPWVVVGVLMDFSLNMLATFMFLELPQEPLLTGRCERLMATGNPWRANLAAWICHEWLDPFQSGGHCRKYTP